MMAPNATSVSQREASSRQGFPALSKMSHIVRTFWRGTTIYSLDDPTTSL